MAVPVRLCGRLPLGARVAIGIGFVTGGVVGAARSAPAAAVQPGARLGAVKLVWT